MITVTIDKAGKIALPKEVLEESHIKPETEVVVVVASGKITLLDRKQALRERMEVVDREMRERLRQALEAGGHESFFAGLSLDAYLTLSEEEEKALWDRLAKEASREVQPVEREIPSHFRPAGQERRTGGTPRRHPR
jgi:bifunctional DNA-binding transcriptional regulator/antitoxin component of YhaV-PrlF toxin-antitoxin module